ncbi:hypothetical protein JY651_03885 [Pyxidicoccus parkwayensis]|uniref:Uncharacterized protein n=1 Tax=Pyxidicoccus parkwayensis TaxID=2813578 RepID=A0ABX7P0C3_9BACT|nr:hypothetical protein [Pyxidicoccus parkwaysis]QSQ24126.1 hypothetical protein JY651_03885 [Pyxidicoccus parkwaysis]
MLDANIKTKTYVPPTSSPAPKTGTKAPGTPKKQVGSSALREATAKAEKARTTAAKKQHESQVATRKATAAAERQKTLQGKRDALLREVDAHGGKWAPSTERQKTEALKKTQKDLDAAQRSATKAQKDAEAARQAAVTSANEALAAQKAANAQAAREKVAPPYPLADKVTDGFDANRRLSAAEQRKLFGAPQAASPREAAQEDAKRVARALSPPNLGSKNPLDLMKPGSLALRPEAASKELAALLEKGTSPEYRKALLEAVKPQLEAIGGTLSYPAGASESQPTDPTSGKETLEALGKASSTLRPEEQRALAEGLVSGIGSDEKLKQGTSEGLRESLRRGEGGAFSVQLATAFERAGKSRHAESVARTAQAEVKEIREDFAAKSKKVEELNAQVARLAASFGPAMTQKEQQNALNAFKARHKAEYGALEDAAKKLEGALEASNEVLKQPDSALFKGRQGGLPGFADEALETQKQLKGFVGTDVGQKFIDAEVAKQANQEPSFLDGVSNWLKSPKLGKDAQDIAKGLTTSVTKGLASAALKAAASGENVAGAKRVFENVLGKNPVLFGVTAEDMNTLKGHFNDLLDNKKGAAEALDKELRKLSVEPPGTTGASGAGSALRGLGVVAGLFGAANSVTDAAKELDLANTTKALGDTLSASADTSLFVLDVFGKNAQAATKVLGKLGPAGGVLGAVGDGLAAAKAFGAGDTVEGFAKTASAAGGALLAAAALSQSVPVAGQVVGGLLFAVGTGVSLWNESQKRQESQQDTKAFLRGAGFSPRLAEQLKDPDTAMRTGRFLTQMAERLHTTPQELRQRLERLTDRKQLDTFFYAVEKTPHGEDGRYVATDDTPGTYGSHTYGAGGHGASQAYSVTEYYLQSLADAEAYLRKNGVLV